MVRTTVSLLALISALAGCAAQTDGAGRMPSDPAPAGTRPGLSTPGSSATSASDAAPASSPAPAAGAAVPGHTAGADLRACYDGKCRLTLAEPVGFWVDPRFGVTWLSISFDRHSVRVVATGPGVRSQATFGPGALSSVNGIGIRAVSLSASRAVLHLSPAR
ncbi:hypothetical protein FHS43_002049 [Streptosporangium becharense]|uniref:Lipoprotein n=1 Tax=Streptosporangium becharense TaxID=1816182 RepID=A0A7W9MEH5_9ACTN|nr:hypothetical protein [Streptosporangium becharense]MBB2910786.1 hypothetical protein [Streptosporangium becharense]MBB5817481.1 hypothetical protein [Streptosporangium becharense]